METQYKGDKLARVMNECIHFKQFNLVYWGQTIRL